MNNEQINTVGELIELLKEYNPNSEIRAGYIDMYGEEHVRPLLKKCLQVKHSVAYLNLTY